MASIPDDIRRFIQTSIPSVPYLEAALLFHRSPSETLGPDEVARALYLPKARAAALVQDLADAGIVAPAGPADGEMYRFAPRDAELARAMQGVAEAYSRALVQVASLIHDSTGKNAHRFAAAFKLRKDR